jgi:hypothetical protein
MSRPAESWELCGGGGGWTQLRAVPGGGFQWVSLVCSRRTELFFFLAVWGGRGVQDQPYSVGEGAACVHLMNLKLRP